MTVRRTFPILALVLSSATLLAADFATPEGRSGRVEDLGGGVWRVRLAEADGSFSDDGALQTLAAYLDEKVPACGAPDGSRVEVSANPFSLKFYSKTGREVRTLTELKLTDAGISVAGPLARSEGVYGFGERFDRFNQRGNRLILYTYDGWNISDTSYIPVPFFTTTSGAGLLVNDYSYMEADVGRENPDLWRVTGECRRLDVYVWATDRIVDAVCGFHRLQGGSSVPPEWSDGPIVNRYGPDLTTLYGYNGWTYAKGGYWEGKPLLGVGVHETLRRYGQMGSLPKAVLPEGWTVEMFSGSDVANERKRRFAELGTYMRGRGLKTIVYIRVGAPIAHGVNGYRDGFCVRADVLEGDRVVRKDTDLIPAVYMNGVNPNPDSGKIYGAFRQIDVTDPEMWDWYVNRIWKEISDLGADGVKVDFCELFPDNGRRYGDKTIRLKWKHPEVFGRQGTHNAYPTFFVTKLLKEMNRLTAKRGGFLVFARGGGIGIGRAPYVWTGDQTRAWDKLDDQLFGILNAGMSGIPFMSADFGGYQYPGGSCVEPIAVRNLKDGEIDASRTEPRPNEEQMVVRRGKKLSAAEEERIFARALGYTAFTPCVQSHGYVRNPYEFSEATRRQYVRLMEFRKGALAPYLRAATLTAARTGLPVVRPLVLRWQDDPKTHSIGDEYLFGDALLVAPILSDTTARTVYLPRGRWKDLRSGEVYDVPAAGCELTVKVPLNEIALYLDLDASGGSVFREGKIN